MNLLIFGTGVISSIIGSQLQNNAKITHFVRPSKINDIKTNGILLTCTDLRKVKDQTTTVLYKPNTIDSLESIIEYDACLLSVKSNQLIEVLNEYGDQLRKIPLFLMQNISINDFDFLQEKFKGNVSFLYPFIMGGGRTNNKIECTICNSIINNMVIGNFNNQEKSIEKQLYRLLDICKLKPIISKNIVAYLKLHYVWAACALASYIHSGTYIKFLQLKEIADSYKAMVECFNVFRKNGINSRKIYPYVLYHFPAYLLALYSRNVYKKRAMEIMVVGHITSSPDEMKIMFDTVYQYCINDISIMPIMQKYKNSIDQFYMS